MYHVIVLYTGLQPTQLTFHTQAAAEQMLEMLKRWPDYKAFCIPDYPILTVDEHGNVLPLYTKI